MKRDSETLHNFLNTLQKLTLFISNLLKLPGNHTFYVEILMILSLLLTQGVPVLFNYPTLS